MKLEQELTELIDSGDKERLMAFLQKLTDAEKKSLVPRIRAMGNEVEEAYASWPSVKTPQHDLRRKMLGYPAYWCFNRREFERASFFFLSEDDFGTMMDQYIPEWLGSWFLSEGEQDPVYFVISYSNVMKLTGKTAFEPSANLVAKTLPLFAQEGERGDFSPQIEKLTIYPDTLEKHIWHLFEAVSMVPGNMPGERGWLPVFKSLTAEGKLDRQRVLRESLRATLRNFNMNHTGGFVELFNGLEPSEEELIVLREDILNMLNAPHSKPVGAALQAIRKIQDHAAFQPEAFLEHAQELITSRTKSVVNGTLQILEKIAKRQPVLRQAIAVIATQALMHPDEALQSRAAKLILRLGEPQDASLKENIALQAPSLMSSTVALLAPFVSVEAPALQAEETTVPVTRLSPKNVVTLPANVDDLLFLAAQALENQEPYHIDLLADAFVRLDPEIRGANIARLAPVLQRVYKFATHPNSRTGILDILMGFFLLDYARHLAKQFPRDARVLMELEAKYLQDNRVKQLLKRTGLGKSEWYLTSGNNANPGDPSLYLPHEQQLLTAFSYILAGRQLPLLQTPTHLPAWIDPVVLVERLAQHQQHQTSYAPTDLQMAIGRLAPENNEAALALARKTLNGELLRLMEFLLQPGATPEPPFENEAAWLMAALVKSPQAIPPAFGTFSFMQMPRQWLTGSYPWQIVEHQPSTAYYSPAAPYKLLEFDTQWNFGRTGADERFLAKLRLTRKKKSAQFLPEMLRCNPHHMDHLVHTDVKRFMLIAPRHPDMVLSQVAIKCMQAGSLSSEPERYSVTAALESLYASGHMGAGGSYQFMAIAMQLGDKTAATIVAELWIRGVREKNFNSVLLGHFVGKMQTTGMYPLKRITDLLQQNCFNISAGHNIALLELMTALLKEMPAEPPTGFKKLLEIFREVLVANKAVAADEQLKTSLAEWGRDAGLAKTIKSIPQ